MKINSEKFLKLLSESITETLQKHNLLNEYYFDPSNGKGSFMNGIEDDGTTRIPFKEELMDFKLDSNENLPQDGEEHTPEQIAMRLILSGKKSIEDKTAPAPVITNKDKWWWGDSLQEKKPSLQYGIISLKYNDEVETINVRGFLYELDYKIQEVRDDVEDDMPLNDVPHTDADIYKHLLYCYDSGMGAFTTDHEYWWFGNQTDEKPVISNNKSKVPVSMSVFDEDNEAYVGTIVLDLNYTKNVIAGRFIHELREKGEQILSKTEDTVNNEGINIENRGKVIASFTKEEIENLKLRGSSTVGLTPSTLFDAIKTFNRICNVNPQLVIKQITSEIKTEEQKKEIYKHYADYLNYVNFAVKEKYGRTSEVYNTIRDLSTKFRSGLIMALKRTQVEDNNQQEQ